MKAMADVVVTASQDSRNVDNRLTNQQSTQQFVGNDLTSENLLGGKSEVVIRHQNESYVLRLTKQNKLILTK